MKTEVVHCRRSRYDVYVGRPGPWGNPFRLRDARDENERQAVIERFARWGERQPWLLDAVRKELRGLRLGCWCAPKPCHGEVLARWAEDSSRRLIFVFGSNEAGRHGRGAARDAVRLYGAQLGLGEGLAGESYALPTKDACLRPLPLPRIREAVWRFLEYARAHPAWDFLVTRIGCGLSGYRDTEIAPMFEGAPANIHLPGRWVHLLDPGSPARVIVAGSRSLDTPETRSVIDNVLQRVTGRFEGRMVVVSGGARGVDLLGEEWAVRHGAPLARFPALWRSQGEAAGMERNRRMAWYATHLVAFWDGRSRGTRHMIETAQGEGLPTWVVRVEQPRAASVHLSTVDR